MTFQPSIPLATDLISVSQNDIKNNFTAIGTSFDVNHVDFNVSGAGKHKFVELPNQSGDPAGAATEMTIFSKLSSGASQLFYKRDASATAYQLTGLDPTGTTNGRTFLPGGFILVWGVNMSVANNVATGYSGGLSFPNNCFVFIPISISATDIIPIAVQSSTTTQFTIKFTAAANIPIKYIAIGN